jgi:hypothetical protein
MRNGYINQFSKDAFNRTADFSIQDLSDFVAIHYGMSMREDTPYWKHVTNNIEYNETEYHEGLVYIATGMGIKQSVKSAIVEQNITEHIKDLEHLVEQMPSHYEYLKSEIYK